MIQQVFWTMVVRVSLIAAGFLSSIVTVHFLGPEGRGVFFYWSTLAALVIQFGNLGLHSSNTYYLIKGRAKLSTLAANSLWCSVVFGIAFGGLMSVVLLLQGQTLQNKWPFLVPTFVMIPAGLYFLFGTNLLVAQGRIGAYNCFEFTNRYVGLCAVLFAAWYWRTPESILAVLSIVAVLICLPLYRSVQVSEDIVKLDLRLIRDGFGYSLRAYLVSALPFLVLRLNVVLLKQYANPVSLGVYSIAVQMLDIINVIPATVALVLFPRIMRSSVPYRLMRVNLYLLTGLLALVYVVTAWFGRDLIIRVYGEPLADAYNMLLWGLPGSLCCGLIGILSQYLAATGIPLALLWIWLVGLAIEWGLAVWLLPAYGGMGAMGSLSATYMIILGLIWYLVIYTGHKGRVTANAE